MLKYIKCLLTVCMLASCFFLGVIADDAVVSKEVQNVNTEMGVTADTSEQSTNEPTNDVSANSQGESTEVDKDKIPSVDENLIEEIRVRGLVRLPKSTVLNYFPLEVGDAYTQKKVTEGIKDLYETGLFKEVSIEKEGNVLIIKLIEQPTIEKVEFKGIRLIKEKDMKANLAKGGLVAGKVFKASRLKGLEEAIIERYRAQGYYNIKITKKITHKPNNRVLIILDVDEGKVTTITSIKVSGNTLLTTAKVIEKIGLYPTRPWSFLLKNNVYSTQMLDEGIRNLSYYYANHGRLQFNVKNKNIEFSQEERKVSIGLQLDEGKVFLMNQVFIVGIDQKIAEKLVKQLKIKSGMVFSKEKIIDAQKVIQKLLLDYDIDVNNIEIVPNIDADSGKVSVTYKVSPGKATIVRHIDFHGNNVTADYVLRRELRQLEGAPLSHEALEQSKRRLSNLPYLKDIKVKMVPTEIPDVIDVDFDVVEHPSQTLTAQAGYSSAEGVLFSLGASQDNFLGMGNKFGFDVQHSSTANVLSFTFENPYYTPLGVSRYFSAQYKKANSKKFKQTQYSVDEYAGSLGYRVPISESMSWDFAYSYGYSRFNNTDSSSKEVQNFVNSFGRNVSQFKINSSYSIYTLNQAVKPSSGIKQQFAVDLGLPFGGRSINYYSVSSETGWYYLLHKIKDYDIVLKLSSKLGYVGHYGRTKDIPFFKRLYAGGVDSVRGFQMNSLGVQNEEGKAKGGNILTVAGAEILLPNPYSEMFSPVLFVTGGNVFENKFKFSDIRYSYGVAIQLVTPIAPITITFAQPLNARKSDHKKLIDIVMQAVF